MKVFAVVLCALFASVAAASYGGGAAPAPSGGYGAPAPSGGTSIPAPPCPKNYLFSCQPSLSPAPCSPGAAAPSSGGGYGSAGAYSEHIPSYINSPYAQQQAIAAYYQALEGLQGLQGLGHDLPRY